MKRQWTCEEANAWYAEYPWIRGCNFIGSDCANRRDMWQSYKNDERMATADRELALAEKTGFNTVRLIMDFDVWLQERESYMEILEKYIALCAAHGQSVMLTLTAEAQLPRGDFADFKPKTLGEQNYALGYHQGRGPLPPEEAAKAPYHWLENPALKDKFLTMIRDIVGRYAHDGRVIVWNVYNEPGITIRERSIPLLNMIFETVRSLDPDQPLAADIWRGIDFNTGLPKTAEERLSLELSDIISYHSYTTFPQMVLLIEALKKFNRPLFCTEWLNRINHSNVKELYPLFHIENIANYCWGFVVGKTQTNEPWENLWKQYYDPNKHVDYDFTVWQHDLFRANLRPYDPKETELIEMFNKLDKKN